MVDVVPRSFLETGYAALGQLFEPAECRRLLEQIKAGRPQGPDLFLDEATFKANPVRRGVNPRPGRNALETMDMTAIDAHPALSATLEALLGQGYRPIMKKAVAAVPTAWIPAWVMEEIKDAAAPNLGAYVKPEYRDITYFHGIDFHQDAIDYPALPSDFITVYIYLDEVRATDSPLYVLPGSHRLGVTTFPHALTKLEDEQGAPRWRYEDQRGQAVELGQEVLMGAAGSVYLWHACVLHGTQPSQLKPAEIGNRVSLRYVLQKDPAATATPVDRLNGDLRGPLNLETTRIDVDQDWKPVVFNNIINAN